MSTRHDDHSPFGGTVYVPVDCDASGYSSPFGRRHLFWGGRLKKKSFITCSFVSLIRIPRVESVATCSYKSPRSRDNLISAFIFFIMIVTLSTNANLVTVTWWLATCAVVISRTRLGSLSLSEECFLRHCRIWSRLCNLRYMLIIRPVAMLTR